MIQSLLQQIVTLLHSGFSDVISEPADHIVSGPVVASAASLPTIAVYPGNMEISQTVKENGSSQPRPQELRETIAVNPANPGGPYNLAKLPLSGSLRCQLIFDPGTVTERRTMLIEGPDFVVDYQNATIVFTTDLATAAVISLGYSFIGVFTICEFQQEFVLDVYDDSWAKVEQWTSLATGMILTNYDEFLRDYNVTNKTEYNASRFVTTHSIDRIQLLKGTPGSTESIFNMQLTYRVNGQLKLTKEIVDGFGLIEKIHSPGRISDQPIDIEIGVA